MEQTYIVNGTVENGQIIHLDEPVPISTKRVSVIIKPAPQKSYNGEALFAWLEQLHERRNKLGIKSLTKEEIDAWIQEERDSWGD
jgi:hypothetical protein